jgi:putative transposase
METLTPKDHAEAIALYRSEIVGSLTHRQLERGDLQAALVELSKQRFCPPRSHGARTYSVPTLERWYYAFKSGGLAALRPQTRADKGRARELAPEMRSLIADIRRERPAASVPLILAALEAEGRLERNAVSASTVRRFLSEAGLDRVAAQHGRERDKIRLRWEASGPGALWHGDVCHARGMHVAGRVEPVRIHALLDDASRYVVAIEARRAEREVDMLDLMMRALRRHGAPDALYLDNGSTYRGATLGIACARLGVTLVHAKPYDAPARGKMERFWRTLREQCLDHLGSVGSLHDINVRLYAWVDEHYHVRPHGGLMGKTPAVVYESAPREVDVLDEARLRDALTVQARRRVRRDSTLSMHGQTWQTDLHFLGGRLVTVGHCLALPDEPPWIEHESKRFALAPVDPKANGARHRSASNLDAPHEAQVEAASSFDPNRAFLDRSLGRRPAANSGGEESK